MRLIISLVTIFVTTAAYSADIIVMSPFGPSGSSHQTTQFVADAIATVGHKTEAKSFNNCALARTNWDSSEKAVMLRDPVFNSVPLINCRIPTTTENIIIVANRSPLFFCNNGPNGKTMEDFLKPGSRHSVGDSMNAPTAQIFKRIDSDVKNHTRAIPFDYNTQTAAAAKSGEIDFIIASGLWPEQQLGAKCFWHTGDVTVEGYKRAIDIWPNNKMLQATYSFWFIAKGFNTKEMADLRKTISDQWSTNKDWIELRKKRGWEDRMVPTDLKIAVQQIETEYKIWTDPNF